MSNSKTKIKSVSLPAALKRRRKLDRDMLIYERYNAGMSTASLCKLHDLNRSQVCKIIREINKALAYGEIYPKLRHWIADKK